MGPLSQEQKERLDTVPVGACRSQGTVGLRAASASWKGSEEGFPLLLHLIEREETLLIGVAKPGA